MTDPQRELDFCRFLVDLTTHLDPVQDVDKALKVALRLARDTFGAAESCIATLDPAEGRVALGFLSASDAGETLAWDTELFESFLAGRRPKIPHNLLLAQLERRGRRWAALALRRGEGGFSEDEVRAIGRAAAWISRQIERMDRQRTYAVRARIDRKIIEQLRPKDLFYQVLHGLRSLTGYDHSASLFIQTQDPERFELVAEQIAWRKAKSDLVGGELELSSEARSWLESGDVYGFDRLDEGWQSWNEPEACTLAAAVDHNTLFARVGETRAEGALLCAPLSAKDGLVGLLKIASCHPGTLGAWEAEIVGEFLPQVSATIRSLKRTESLEHGMLRAEKKNAMADLARGVSHDINNALGAALPVVQQLLEDVRTDGVEREVLVADLEQVEASMQLCRRIFGGMLQFARSAFHEHGEGNLGQAIRSTLAVLEDGMRRRGIRLHLELPADLPSVRASQNDLDQLFLNLAQNACDAMPRGGDLRLSARRDEFGVLVEIEDTGCGIPRDRMAHVLEPFYTTKPQGSGLGLSICSSIVGTLRGRLEIDSEVDRGTLVRVSLPAVGSSPTPLLD